MSDPTCHKGHCDYEDEENDVHSCEECDEVEQIEHDLLKENLPEE
ncbi:MAG: hypothetical protein ABIC91_02195 [Nanoarchaeota archaeon]